MIDILLCALNMYILYTPACAPNNSDALMSIGAERPGAWRQQGVMSHD